MGCYSFLYFFIPPLINNLNADNFNTSLHHQPHPNVEKKCTKYMLRIEIESYFCCSTGGIILKSRSFQQFCFRFLPSFSNTHFDYSRVFSSVCSNVAWDFLFVFQLFCWHKKRNMDIFSYTWMFPLWIRSNHATYNVFYTEIRQHQHKYPTPQCEKKKKNKSRAKAGTGARAGKKQQEVYDIHVRAEKSIYIFFPPTFAMHLKEGWN